MLNKSWALLTQAEIEAEEKLTVKESRAVEDLVRAARLLPKVFTLKVDDEGLHIGKRITPGYSRNVAAVKRRSFKF